MKTTYRKIVAAIFLIFSIPFAQQDIRVKLSETDLNQAFATIIDARGVNWGDYTGAWYADAWFVNLDGCTVDIKNNNAITIHANIVATAEDALLFTDNITVHTSFDIDGTYTFRSSQQWLQIDVQSQWNKKYISHRYFFGPTFNYLFKRFYKQNPRNRNQFGYEASSRCHN